jgi:hypothetical protein
MQRNESTQSVCAGFKVVSLLLADPAQRKAYEQLQQQTPSAKRLTLRQFISSNYLPHFRIQKANYGLHDHFATTVAHR